MARMTHKGHSRSPEIKWFDRRITVFKNDSLIVTVALSCSDSEITEIQKIIGEKSRFFVRRLYLPPLLKVTQLRLSTLFSSKKTSMMELSGGTNYDDVFSTFDTKSDGDKQTDRHASCELQQTY